MVNKINESITIARRCPSLSLIHNIYTFYEPNGGDKAFVSFCRPQDWGDPSKWNYFSVDISVPGDDERFTSRRCHVWCRPHSTKWDFLRKIGGLLFSFAYPGTPEQECDRSCLRTDDFWSEDWGVMPLDWDEDEDDLVSLEDYQN
jgi:hypothetical protein